MKGGRMKRKHLRVATPIVRLDSAMTTSQRCYVLRAKKTFSIELDCKLILISVLQPSYGLTK